jgi:hypothetical protein
MTAAETLSQYYGIAYRVIMRQTDGLTQEDSLVQPPFRGNCLNWVLGHIINGRNTALKYLGGDPVWGEEICKRYERNSEPIAGEAENILPLPQLLHDLEVSQERIQAALKQISPERLATVIDEDTLEEQVRFLHWHETYHVGQLELLRQLTGKNDKVI